MNTYQLYKTTIRNRYSGMGPLERINFLTGWGLSVALLLLWIIALVFSQTGCQTIPTGPNSAQSGYLGMWYQRAPINAGMDTLNFTGPTECTVTDNGSSFSPDMTTWIGFASPNSIAPAGDTAIGMTYDYPGTHETFSLSIYLSHDSLIGQGIVFTR